MENMYLMIENPGVAPEQAFTLLGASTKRGTNNTSIIGKFGTGNKQAVGVCLRNNLSPVVYAGLLRMEFNTRQEIVNDGIKNTEFNRVVVKFSGKDETTGSNRSSSQDLGFVLEHGATEWIDIDLALREFISNALDRSIEQGLHNHIQQFLIDQETANPGFIDSTRKTDTDEYELLQSEIKNYQKIQAKDYKNVIVTIVEENRVRAKSGFTRIFVPLTTDVFKFFTNLDKWFLHFNSPELLDQVMIPTANRGINGNNVVIYRRGVRVREIPLGRVGKPTIPLFDYNLENLHLDEARKTDEYNCTANAVYALKSASVSNLRRIFQAIINQQPVWELGLPNYYKELTAENKKNWQDAWEEVAGSKSIVSIDVRDGGIEGVTIKAESKGYQVYNVNPEFFNMCVELSLPNAYTVLTKDERAGREISEPTPAAINAVDYIWEKIENFQMTNGKCKPQVKIFSMIMNCGSQLLGYQSGDLIYLNRDIVPNEPNAFNPQLLATVLEEIAHYVTGATDNSRDFQDYVINFAIHSITK